MSIVKHVCKAMETIAPLRLAEKWDNVGLILESPFVRPNARNVLLTIDLTSAVLEEALATPTSVIVSYHPPIFRGLKSVTTGIPLQKSLLQCAAAGISVYSPHTSLDAVRGGLNDWLAMGFGSGEVKTVQEKDAESGAGIGRVTALESPVTLDELAQRIKRHLNLSLVQVATPDVPPKEIRTVATCAGSGADVLRGVDADVYFTGEMSHHEVLEAAASGKTVILCGHTNTERGYLPTLRSKLQATLNAEADSYDVTISEKDRHPLVFV